MKKLAIILLAVLSACSTRKVTTNKTITESKETAVQVAKIDSTTVNVVKKEVEAKEANRLIDTGKMVAENKTVIEFFSTDGKLTKRITSNSKKAKSNYIAVTKTKEVKSKETDSTFLTLHSELKDSTVVEVKKVEKVKQSEAKRANFLMFGIVLCFAAWAAWFLLRK